MAPVTISAGLGGNFCQKVIDELSAQQENHGGSRNVDDSNNERVPGVQGLEFGTFLYLYFCVFVFVLYCFLYWFWYFVCYFFGCFEMFFLCVCLGFRV